MKDFFAILSLFIRPLRLSTILQPVSSQSFGAFRVSNLHPQPLPGFACKICRGTLPCSALRQGFQEQPSILLGQHAAIQYGNHASI